MMDEKIKVKTIRELTGLTGSQIDYFRAQGVVPAAGTYTYSVENRSGYRYYKSQDIPKFHQIAMYYELGYARDEIRDIMLAKDYDVNKALDDIYHQMEEKRNRLERHMIAVEQIRMLGANGELPGFLKGVNMENMGMYLQRLHTLPVWKELEAAASELFTDENAEQLQSVLLAYTALDDETLAEAGNQAIREMMTFIKDLLGALGYILVVSTAIAVRWNGTLPTDVEDALGVTFSMLQAEALINWIKEDFVLFRREITQLMVQYHNFIGEDFENEQIKAMVADVETLVQVHFGIRLEVEYRLLFEALPPSSVNNPKDYVQYIYKAVHHYHTK